MKIIFTLVFLILLNGSAFAQTSSSLPSDQEYDQQRLNFLNEQNKFLAMTILRDRAKAEELAAWWDEIWKDLVEAKAEVKTGQK